MSDPNNVRSDNMSYADAYAVSSQVAASPVSQDSAYEPPQPSYAQAQASPVYVAAAPQKKSHGWIVAIVVIVCVFLLILGSLVSCSTVAGSIFSTAGSYSAEDTLADLREPAIGVIELNGTIQYDGSSCSPEGLQTLLDRAQSNDHIEAVILKVNSGGGVATAGEEMSDLVRDFTKPIVVVSQATNASAAYEISSQADYIFTDKTTAIGAIGVFMSVTDLSGLYDKLGISVENIKSADSKDAGAGNRPLTDEERAWYQSMVDQINEVFIEAVAQGRDMDIESVRELANGLPYTGIDAVENGLADEIGDMDDAVSHLSDLLGYDTDLPVVDLMSHSSDLADIIDLLGESKDGFSDERLLGILNKLDGGNLAQ